MANPINVALPANQWTKVATAVTSGNLYIGAFFSRTFYYTHRVTGDPVPTDLTDAVVYDRAGFEVIDSEEDIDVYIYCKSTVGTAGSIRVAL